MAEKFSGGEFLHKKYPELKKSEPVKLSHEFSLEKEANPIDTWLKSVESFHKRHRDNPEAMYYIRNAFHNEYVIRAENIPDSYFENQRRLARERGEGNIEITPEIKKQFIEQIIQDQKSTLDNWVNYLTSPDADAYSLWAKYWAFRSMVKLSSYDKEKKDFGLRDKHTVNPFPELNHEALAYTIDVITKKAKKENISLAENNPELEKLIKGENFGKIYGYFIDKSTPSETNDELLKTTKGQWIKYEKGSNPKALAESLKGHFTGWCITSEPTAETYLKDSNFYIYYSNDKNGKPNIPRAGIEIKEDEIAAVHGIAKGQNLDPHIADILEEKLEKFPDKEKYKKKTADMKLLTQIDNKLKKGEEPTKDELKFLYEIDNKIEGFGLENDSRIEEIKKSRNPRQDYAAIFHCRPEQVAQTIDEIKETTIVFSGDLELIIMHQLKEFPANLTHITGNLILSALIEELPPKLTYIGGILYIKDSQIKKLPANIEKIVKGKIIK